MNNKKYIIAFFPGFVLIVGILVLMAMQLEWITQAAKTTRGEIEKNIFINVSQVLDKVHGELDDIFSFLQISPRDYKDKNWTAFYNNLSILKSDTNFFEYLENIVLLPVDKNEKVLIFSQQEEVFLPAALPRELEEIYTISEKQNIRELLRIMDERRLYFLPISNTEMKEPSLRFMDYNAFLFIHFNLPRFYTFLLQTSLKKSLAGYDFCIIDYRNAVSISEMSTGDKIPSHRKPDFVFPLRYPITNWSGPQNSGKEKIGRNYKNTPGLHFFFLNEGFGNLNEKNGAPGLQLKIYYPEGPLVDIIARHTLLNRTVSISILFIFILSIIFLFRTYIKIDQQREREQEFIATISHELRTPLAVIQSASENLSSGIVRNLDRIQDYGKTIREHGKRLTHMVENMLLYAGLQARPGKIKKPDTWISLDDIIKDIIFTFEELTLEKKTRLIVNKEIKNLYIKVDAMSLKLLLENIIMNALLHGTDNEKDDNEIHLLIKRKVIKGITIIIEDNGPGIQKKERKKVFKPFYRGSYTTCAQIPGSGLGLHLVKRVVEMLGGIIRLTSPYKDITGKIKSGVRIVLELPLEVKDE